MFWVFCGQCLDISGKCQHKVEPGSFALFGYTEFQEKEEKVGQGRDKPIEVGREEEAGQGKDKPIETPFSLETFTRIL